MSKFNFSLSVKVRIDDINYGNHVGYQKYFSFFQDVRIEYLNQFGFTELDICGFGMIISEANCRYKQELFFGDNIIVKCKVSSISFRIFTMGYQILKDNKICANGFTKNLCYDYSKKDVINLPKKIISAISEFEGIELE